MKPIDETIKEMRAIGAQALRDNPKKAQDMMRKDHGRCCLCVMQDAVNEKYQTNWWGDDHVPNLRAMEEYGFDQCNPRLPCPAKTNGPVFLEMIKASHLNDGDLVDLPVDGLPHKYIAECLENYGKAYVTFSFYIQHKTHNGHRVKAELVECEPYTIHGHVKL